MFSFRLTRTQKTQTKFIINQIKDYLASSLSCADGLMVLINYKYNYCKRTNHLEQHMAFVINKTEKSSIFDTAQNDRSAPGPGAYNSILTNKTTQHCAPFNTSDIRVSYFEVQQTKYGPGSYEPIYFKDVSKSSKVNPSHPFVSQVSRFPKEQQDKPKKNADNSFISTIKNQQNDTTHYTVNSLEKNAVASMTLYQEKLLKSKSVMDQIRQVNNDNKIQSIKGKREFIRVLLTSSTNSENIESRYIYRNIKGKTLGPGSYQKIEFESKPKSVTKWGLDKKERFKTEGNDLPGPGQYMNDPSLSPRSQLNYDEQNALQKNKRLSASFASTVIRSHMDTLIYRTNIPIKAAILQDKRMKDTRPGPGSYNTTQLNKDKRSFNYGCQTNFGGTDRNFTDNNVEPQPGPGSYDVFCHLNRTSNEQKNEKTRIIKQIRKQIFGKKGKIENNDNKQNSLTRSYKNRMLPDPNFINPSSQRQRKQKKMVKFCSLEERCFSKLGNMSQQERFNNSTAKNGTELGPGVYYNQSALSDFKNQDTSKGAQYVFKSVTNRQINKIAKTQTEVPFYNIFRNDIGFRAQKIKRYIENLKKINIQKSPFQISSERFKQNGKDDLNMIVFMPEQNQKRVQSQNKGNQQSASFKSATKRNPFKSEEKPGPGEYDSTMRANGVYSSLQKKSFNKYYGLHQNFSQMNETAKLGKAARKNSKTKERGVKKQKWQQDAKQIKQNEAAAKISPDMSNILE